VHVFLPREYESSGRAYPCIYFNDGNTVFWNGGLGNKSWNVSRTLTSLYAQNSLKSKVIVVAIVPNDREWEYTHVWWAPTR
jgi:predicted alpha/beta superfamily hydrolase